MLLRGTLTGYRVREAEPELSTTCRVKKENFSEMLNDASFHKSLLAVSFEVPTHPPSSPS